MMNQQLTMIVDRFSSVVVDDGPRVKLTEWTVELTHGETHALPRHLCSPMRCRRLGHIIAAACLPMDCIITNFLEAWRARTHALIVLHTGPPLGPVPWLHCARTSWQHERHGTALWDSFYGRDVKCPTDLISEANNEEPSVGTQLADMIVKDIPSTRCAWQNSGKLNNTFKGPLHSLQPSGNRWKTQHS